MTVSMRATVNPSNDAGTLTARGGQRAGAVIWFVWGVWAVMTLADLVWVAQYGCKVPLWDEWEMVPALTGHDAVDLTWIWKQHNEHRFIWARLLLFGLYRLAGLDFRAAVFVNVLLMAAVAAAMIRAAAALRGRVAFTDAFFPLAFLHFGHSENLIWSWQLVYILPVALAGSLLIIVVRAGTGLSGRWCWAAGGLLAALPFCGGLGLVYVPWLIVWLAYAAVDAWRANRRRDGLVSGGFVLATALLSAVYFIGFQRPIIVPPSSWVVSLTTCFQFLSVAFGMVDTRYWQAWGLLMAALLTISLLQAVRVTVAERAERCGLSACLRFWWVWSR